LDDVGGVVVDSKGVSWAIHVTQWMTLRIVVRGPRLLFLPPGSGAGPAIVPKGCVFDKVSESHFVLQSLSTIMAASGKPLEVLHENLDALADTNVDSVDSNVRYMAYGARIRTALRASTRYVAYVR
jgi:hypothetical protein